MKVLDDVVFIDGQNEFILAFTEEGCYTVPPGAQLGVVTFLTDEDGIRIFAASDPLSAESPDNYSPMTMILAKDYSVPDWSNGIASSEYPEIGYIDLSGISRIIICPYSGEYSTEPWHRVYMKVLGE